MQGILQEAGVIQPKKRSNLERYKNVPKSRESNVSRSTGNLSRNDLKPGQKQEERAALKTSHGTTMFPTKTNRGKLTVKKRDTANAHTLEEEDSKITHRAMQTEREEDLVHLYDTGVIKYPSAGILKLKRTSPQPGGQGDQSFDDVSVEMEKLTTEDKDFIKENKHNIKIRPTKQSPKKVITQAPPTYQRGVLPKYLRDKKEEELEVHDADCPPGHILLPEEERKETLRVLRQSYADRIQELNMMPVRNDTLKMRKRKMEIEEELKRIDGGIKVFQRPKVFVKINA